MNDDTWPAMLISGLRSASKTITVQLSTGLSRQRPLLPDRSVSLVKTEEEEQDIQPIIVQDETEEDIKPFARLPARARRVYFDDVL